MTTQTADFFQARLDTMIDLRHPLAVLATRLPWAQLETSLAPVWERKSREGILTEEIDLIRWLLRAILRLGLKGLFALAFLMSALSAMGLAWSGQRLLLPNSRGLLGRRISFIC